MDCICQKYYSTDKYYIKKQKRGCVKIRDFGTASYSSNTLITLFIFFYIGSDEFITFAMDIDDFN